MPCGDLMMLTKQGIINIMDGQCWMIKTDRIIHKKL